MRLGDGLLPALLIIVGETQFLEVLDDHVGIENAHDELFAEGCRHGRKTQFDFLPLPGSGLDAAILRPAFFDDIHAPQNLDAAGHGCDYGCGNLVDLMQHAINAKAHVCHVAPWLDMNVAGAFVEGVLQQPVHQTNDVLVVGIQFAAGTKLNQLFEIGDIGKGGAVQLTRTLDRTCKAVELHQIAVDVLGIGDDALDLQAQDARQFGFPLAHIGLADGNDYFLGGDADRQDLVPLRVSARHDLGDGSKVDLEWIDVQIRKPHFAGQPFG